jgi:phytol kinase
VHDVFLALGWLAILFGGVGLCLWLASAGMPRTYVRDLLHVGAGVWPLGWPGWQSRWAPIVVAALGALVLAAVPWLARRLRWAEKVQRSVSGDGERWSGLVLYGLAAAALTAVEVLVAPLPAAAGLLALAFGDGLGGAVGRRWGRHRFRLPWSKEKSLEGSLGVALLSAAGIALAAWRFGLPSTPLAVVAGGLAAAAAEALAPRATDNLTVPAAVWLMLTVTLG